AVVGVPDEHSGEVVKVYIVKGDTNLTEQQVMAHCKEQLTNYKRPKYIEFINELPKNTVGKTLRRELRNR
ncbi:MAG: AMP-binding enzyme, partial [Polynucleobacter victoriensis]